MNQVAFAPTIPARAAMAATDILLPAQFLRSINPLVYSNAAELAEPDFAFWLLWCNAARDIAQPAVTLGQYEPGTLLDASGPFHLLTQGALVLEQTDGASDLAARFVRMQEMQAADPVIEVDRPCLLACRGGHWTWGHWLIDMLAKIVVAERQAPGRFTYVVPADITDPGNPRRYVTNVLESMAAYGVTADRLLRVDAGTLYRFANLFDIADHIAFPTHPSLRDVHPGVLAAMRALPEQGPPAPSALTAILRQAGEARCIINAAALANRLRGHGAHAVTIAELSFLDQVRLFRNSSVIVGDLGSNLAAAIYAPAGAGIVSLAPQGWRDSFFVNLFQRLGFFHADIRGVQANPSADQFGVAPHIVHPAQMEAGLRAVNAARLAPGSGYTVAGQKIARAPGETIWRCCFGVSGDAPAGKPGQFAPAEAGWTWSLGPECRIDITGAELPDTDLWLEVAGAGFTAPPYLVKRPLDIVANGAVAGRFVIGGATRLHVRLPASVLRAKPSLTLIFRHPVCPSPKSMGVSEDDRRLGFRFEHLALRRA